MTEVSQRLGSVKLIYKLSFYGEQKEALHDARRDACERGKESCNDVIYGRSSGRRTVTDRNIPSACPNLSDHKSLPNYQKMFSSSHLPLLCFARSILSRICKYLKSRLDVSWRLLKALPRPLHRWSACEVIVDLADKLEFRRSCDLMSCDCGLRILDKPYIFFLEFSFCFCERHFVYQCYFL